MACLPLGNDATHRDAAAPPTYRSSARRRAVHRSSILLALLLLAGCSGDATPTPVTAAPPADRPTPITIEVTRVVVTERVVTATPEPPSACTLPNSAVAQEVVVAALLPLSQIGSLASTVPVQVALNLAAAEINASGGFEGKPLRLSIIDTGGRAQSAAQAARRAIAEQCAVAILATQSAETITAMAEVAAGSETPLLVLEAADDQLTAAGLPHLFRLAPNNVLLAAMYGEWLTSLGDYNGDGRLESVLVIEGSPTGRGYGDLIAATLKAAGINADIYETDLPRADFTSLIARIVVRDAPPDSLLVRFNGESASAFQRQLAANNIGPQRQTVIVATRAALNDTTFWPLVGEAGAYTVVGRAGPWPTTATDRGRAFAAQFLNWQERWPEAAAFYAYDALWLLRDAAARAASLRGADMIAALESSNLEGAAGRYSFAVTGRTAPDGAEAAGEPAWAWHQWLEPPLAYLQYTAVGQPAAEMTVIWPPKLAPLGPVVRPAAP